MRKAMTTKEKGEILTLIQAKQQQPFKSITISKNDPWKMTNTHSTSKLLKEHEHNLYKYDDLLGPYTTIVTHMANVFQPLNLDYRQLEEDIGTVKPIARDLHKQYLKMTVDEVVKSNKWYMTFILASRLMHKDLTWSTAYYEKNVNPSLYAVIHSKVMNYLRSHKEACSS